MEIIVQNCIVDPANIGEVVLPLIIALIFLSLNTSIAFEPQGKNWLISFSEEAE